MVALPKNIAELISAEKSIAGRPRWDDKTNPRYYILTAPLRVEAVVVGGFEIRVHISKQFVDRDAMMQLEFALSGRDRIELWRCQWKPFETHRNKPWGPQGFALHEFVSQSHHHPFFENFLGDEHRMRGGSLPAALPILPDPSTLSEFIARCGELFNINNINVVEVPHRNTDLFWTPDD